MAEQTHRFKATIAGKSYTIVGQATDDHMQAVTTLLNEQFKQLKQVSPEMSKEDAAVLMAFNAISDQLKLTAKLEAQSPDQSPTSNAEASPKKTGPNP